MSLGFMLVAARPVFAQEPLTLFKNYFITGDYVVRGVSLWRRGVNGKVVANIPPLGGPGGVPATADILSAFLYVQTAEIIEGSGITNARFAGVDLGPYTAPGSSEPGSGTFAKPLVDFDFAPTACWSVNHPVPRKLMTYRVDAFRFLPIDPATGKQSLTTPSRIELPDFGPLFHDDDEDSTERSIHKGPRAIGASLVVVYRDPSMPLKGVVLYDGAHTKRAFARMDQQVKGFYQASLVDPTARMTHIVGDGRPLLAERVLVDGQLVSFNPFRSTLGPKWDNTTFPVPLAAGAESTTVSIAPFPLFSDCLTYSAIVLSTTVQDTDGDGLLDRWETSSNIPDVNDPTGATMLPDLPAMGADPNRKDVYVEIAYLHAAEGTKYGGVPKPAHTHLPTLNALNKVGQAFENEGIRIHFDVGDNHQTSPYVIPAALARGGKSWSETRMCVDPKDPTDPTDDEIIECTLPDGSQGPIPGQYFAFPGTIGWKTGFQLMRDELFGFPRNRKDIVRFGLFGHFVGIPKEPCLNADLTSNFECQDTNPDFHVPRTNSGIGDFPGGDFYVALGAFDDDQKRPVGTDFMQGATFMHELGHGYELTHAGLQSLDPAVPREPNCKPNYHSVMNYLYQLRGLPDLLGIVQMDYSRAPLDLLNEISVLDGAFSIAPQYRSGWYAPLAGSYLEGLTSPATKHCDGSNLLTRTEPDGTVVFLEPPMVRVDAPAVGGDIDWNADGLLNNPVPGIQDINFNGTNTALNPAANDWSNLRLSQLGGRRNVGGYYIDAEGRNALGPLSLDVGRGDIGRGDIGRGDIGRGDIGRGDIGRGDIGAAIGRGDIGRGDIGRGDIGRGDIGRGDIGRGDIGRGVFGGGDTDVGGANEPFAELDLETARAVTGDAPSPANELMACLTDGEGACVTEGGRAPVRLDWQAPHLDQAVAYRILRFAYDPQAIFPPADLPTTPIAIVGGEGTPPTTYFDFEPPTGVNLAYFVIAQFADGTFSGISNFATLVAPVPADPFVPVPLAPIDSAVIAQNRRDIGCSLLPGTEASRGRGYQIVFDWSDSVAPIGSIAGYRVFATHSGAAIPIVDTFVETSEYTFTSCNSFVGDGNLTGWQWRVQAYDTVEAISDWSPWADFQFARCLLDDGETPCNVATVNASGSITDPAGDVPPEPGDADLVSATVLVQDATVTLRVRFAPGTFNPGTTVAQFVLDADQNPATGHAGTDSGCGADNGVIGAEFIVDFGSEVRGTRAAVTPFVGPGCNQFGGGALTAPGSVVYVADGMDVTFPRSMIGYDDGALNFKVVSYRFLGEGFSGVLDRMTDAGLPPGVVVPQ